MLCDLVHNSNTTAVTSFARRDLQMCMMLLHASNHMLSRQRDPGHAPLRLPAVPYIMLANLSVAAFAVYSNLLAAWF